MLGQVGCGSGVQHDGMACLVDSNRFFIPS